MTDRDNITLPRELAEKALEALEHFKLVFGGYSEEVKALRTHLAAEPTKQEPGLMEGLTELARQMKPLDADMAAILHDSLDSLYIEDEPALAAEPTKPEPVAVFDEQMGHPVLLLGSPMLKDKQPLYTAPPALAAEPQKPVTLSRVALAWSNRKGTKFVGNGEKWKHEDCVVPLYAVERVDEPSEDIEALRRENERLREALESIAKTDLRGVSLIAVGSVLLKVVDKAKAALRREET